MKYEPMLATPSTPASNRRPIELESIVARGDFVAQEKLDGLRAIVYCDGPRTRVLNRNGVDITMLFPELQRITLHGVVLDGEIVANDGTFQTVATRGKQSQKRFGTLAAERMHYGDIARKNPCHLVAFDLLEANGSSTTNLPLHTRMTLLRGIIGKRRTVRPVRQSMDILGLWNEIVAKGGEGIICKQVASTYLPGKRASTWIKFKALQTLTCIAYGYISSHQLKLSSIELALVGLDGPVPIGKVGTGWTVADGERYLKRFEAGEQFLVEVSALNRTLSNTLRFPVLVGERSDVHLHAASLDQLDALPFY